MTWLKKIGTVVLKIIGIETGLLPLISPQSSAATVPMSTTSGASLLDRLKAAFNAIITVEQITSAINGPDAKTGSAKLKAAAPYVGALVQDALKEITGKASPKNPAELEAAITQITSSLADALNAYGD